MQKKMCHMLLPLLFHESFFAATRLCRGACVVYCRIASVPQCYRENKQYPPPPKFTCTQVHSAFTYFFSRVSFFEHQLETHKLDRHADWLQLWLDCVYKEAGPAPLVQPHLEMTAAMMNCPRRWGDGERERARARAVGETLGAHKYTLCMAWHGGWLDCMHAAVRAGPAPKRGGQFMHGTLVEHVQVSQRQAGSWLGGENVCAWKHSWFDCARIVVHERVDTE